MQDVYKALLFISHASKSAYTQIADIIFCSNIVYKITLQKKILSKLQNIN